jgi:hypothetical protein
MPADLPDDEIPRRKPGPTWLEAGWRNALAMLKAQLEPPAPGARR